MNTTKFEHYEDTNGEWRWRLVAGNGRIVADSGEGYDSEANVIRAILEMPTWVDLAFADFCAP